MSINEFIFTTTDPPDARFRQYLGEKLEEAWRLTLIPMTLTHWWTLPLTICTREKCFRLDGLLFLRPMSFRAKCKRPTKRGADKYANWERDVKLWRTVQAIAELFSLSCYLNKELSEKTSAADIVAKAGGYKTDIVVNAYKKFTRIGG